MTDYVDRYVDRRQQRTEYLGPLYNGSLETIREELAACEARGRACGCTEFELQIENGYAEVIGTRLEHDSELTVRLREEAAKKKRLEDKEKAELKRLEQKYKDKS